jgi:transposase
MGYVKGESRGQGGLFPQSLDELVGEDSAVRVIDAFVNRLDCAKLGFSKSTPKQTGRPAYDPADLLKLYIYGYLNRVRSTRRLEQESQRNIEVLWLIDRLHPDFKTIADFRRDNAAAIKQVSAAFVQFCREAHLLRSKEVAIDGSKFAGQNARHRNFTEKQLRERLQRSEVRIAQYLQQLDQEDAQDPGIRLDAAQVAAALEALKARQDQVQQWLKQLEHSAEPQISLSDADARKMLTGQGEWVVGYNVQVSVESESHLVVHHDVIRDCNDRTALAEQAKQAQAALGDGAIEVLADRGYSNAEAAAQCEQAEITATVPREHGFNHHGEFFDKREFVYERTSDTYRCPAGEQLSFRGQSKEGQRSYRTQGCAGCSLKAQCTNAASRTVTRHVHEAALEAMDARAKADPRCMRRRASIVEHVFGTGKWLLDGGRLLTRGLQNVSSEISFAMLAYNIRRAMNLRGASWMLEALS